MNKKRTVLSLCIFILSLTTLLITHDICAQEVAPGAPSYQEEVLDLEAMYAPMFVDKESLRIMKYLNPTIQQRQKMHKINMDHLKDTIELNNEEGKKLLERHALMEEDPVDLKKVDQLTDDIAKIRAELHKKRIRKRIAIRKILTAEQRVKYDEMRGYRGTGRPGFLGQGFGPGRGQGRFKGM